jgi:hypothetical protein
MNKKDAALGAKDAVAGTCLAIDPAKLEVDERILLLEEQMRHMQRIIIRLRKEQGNKKPAAKTPGKNLNKDGIPLGTLAIGTTEKSPFLNYLTVEEDGYVVGNVIFASLSAAAEAVSKVRRSGWTFWRLLDGRTLKEAFRD